MTTLVIILCSGFCSWGYFTPPIVIVGLPDAAVKESRDRVSTALFNSGFKFPMGRTKMNLAPADVKKEGLSFDLPTAIGMLDRKSVVQEKSGDRGGWGVVYRKEE